MSMRQVLLLAALGAPRRVIDSLRERHPDLGPWAYDAGAGAWRGDGVTARRVSMGEDCRWPKLFLYFDDGRPTQAVRS